MNKSKRPNPSNLENDIDFISNMPDPILQLILQGLPNTEEVVRTSVLTTRWRYLWTSIPYFSSLDLDCFRVLKPRKKFKKNKFKKFVSWALANKTVDLNTFRLCCAGYYKNSTVKEWIKAVVKRKIKSLDIMFCPGSMTEDINMPVCLMSCDSLEVLRLFLYRCTLHMPNRSGFRTLKVLELNRVHCYESDLPAEFIGMCPLLEELSLIECSRRLINVPSRISSPKLKTLILRNWEKNRFGHKEYCSGIKIDCPELVLLEYVGPRGPLLLNSLDNLKKVVILPEDEMHQKIPYHIGEYICATLADLSHVESLSINLYFIQCIDAAHDEEYKFTASFPNLKTLEVTTTTDAFALKVLIQILRCSPNLESLHLVIQKEHLTADHWAFNEVETSRISSGHLKTVKFLAFDGKKRKMAIARFLLEHGNALEEMVFSWHSIFRYNEKSENMMNKLSTFYKASPTVKLTSVFDD